MSDCKAKIFFYIVIMLQIAINRYFRQNKQVNSLVAEKAYNYCMLWLNIYITLIAAFEVRYIEAE